MSKKKIIILFLLKKKKKKIRIVVVAAKRTQFMIKSIQSALKRNAIKYRLYYNKIPKKHTSPICWKIFKKN